MCPLMGCRCRFNVVPSMLSHFSLCPWISDGWYWCPFCSRPENLFEGSEDAETARPRTEGLRVPLKRKMPILRRLIHLLVPRMTVSVPAPTRVDASLTSPNRNAKYMDSTPELESIAYRVELPANDPQWYYPEAGGVECIEPEASAYFLPSSRSAETSISTAMHTISQTNIESETHTDANR